jgi:hypothetical protein
MPTDDPSLEPVELDSEADFWRGVREEAGRDRQNQGDRADWFAFVRAKANRVPCVDCKRPVGESCMNFGVIPPHVLTKFPAHPRRIIDSERLTP